MLVAMAYKTSVEDYIERISTLRRTGDDASLLYAALELRCGIEAKLRENVWQLKSANKTQRREYKASKLGKTIEESFKSGDNMMLLSVICEQLNICVQLKYFPVSSRLQKIHDELGDFLHHPLWKEKEVERWWERLRALVKEGYGELQIAAAGELLVMPVNTAGEWHLAVKLDPEDPRRPILEEIFNGAYQYRFESFIIKPVGLPIYYENEMSKAEDQ
jgi:hypothetical protein